MIALPSGSQAGKRSAPGLRVTRWTFAESTGPRTATGGGEKTASWQAAKAPTKRRAVSLRIGARLCTLHGHRARPALLTIRGITSEKTPARRMHRRRHRSARDAFRSKAIV